MHEESLCPGCGQPRDETFDPLHDGDNPARTHEYVASPPLRDHACTAMSRARQSFAEANMIHPDGIRFGIGLNPIPQPKGDTHTTGGARHV